MGVIAPHYLLVGGYSKEKVLQVREKATEIFNPKDQNDGLVSDLQKVSFFVLCDASHTRWENEEEYIEKRQKYIQYLIKSDISFVFMAAGELIS
ncbi:TPA: hypothetical protein QCU33_005386 [Bacillus cereus]|nr:hypothetical protein [Bacillus cereus]